MHAMWLLVVYVLIVVIGKSIVVALGLFFSGWKNLVRLVFQFPCSYISPYSSLVGNLHYV